MNPSQANRRFSRLAAAGLSAVLLTACPQLLDDDFELLAPGVASTSEVEDVQTDVVTSPDAGGGSSVGDDMTATTICAVGAQRCEGAQLMACGALQSGWVLAEICASDALCDPLAGCLSPVCSAEDYRCTGARLEGCDADRTGWMSIETCASPEACSSEEARCVTTTCEADARVCLDGQLSTCNSDGNGFDTVVDCVDTLVPMSFITSSLNWDIAKDFGSEMAIDGDQTTSAHVLEGESGFVNLDLGATRLLTRVRVLEDTSANFDLGTWQILYHDGSAFVPATPIVQADEVGFVSVDLADIVTDRVRLQVEPATGANLGVAELEVYAATRSCNGAGDDCADCSPSEYTCDQDGRLWQCAVDAGGYTLAEDCGTQSACDAAAGGCD